MPTTTPPAECTSRSPRASVSRPWTCDEPGHNWRPFADAWRVVFETDRHASWRHPTDTEIHVIATDRERAARGSRRLTWAPGPDDHAILGPGGRTLVWSRRAGSAHRVVAVSVQGGHGGLLLGTPDELLRGGARWVAPASWSPDARAFVAVRGNPFAPLEALAADFGARRTAVLARDAIPGAAAFNGDGAQVAVAGTRRASVAGLLPDGFGPLLGAWATAVSRDGRVFQRTGVRLGEPWDEGGPLVLEAVDALGDLGRWGAPTGIALEPDASGLVLGQRRGAGRERLIGIRLDCGPSDGG